MRDAAKYGATSGGIRVDFGTAMERMRRVRARASRRRSAEELSAHGIHVFFGEGTFSDPHTLIVGARPCGSGGADRNRRASAIPRIPGLAEAGYLTNENVFDLSECPKELLVIGGGPFGCDSARHFRVSDAR